MGYLKSSKMSTGHPNGDAELVVIYLSLEFSEQSVALHTPVSSMFTFQGEIGVCLNIHLFLLSVSFMIDNILLSETRKL